MRIPRKPNPAELRLAGMLAAGLLMIISAGVALLNDRPPFVDLLFSTVGVILVVTSVRRRAMSIRGTSDVSRSGRPLDRSTDRRKG